MSTDNTLHAVNTDIAQDIDSMLQLDQHKLANDIATHYNDYAKDIMESFTSLMNKCTKTFTEKLNAAIQEAEEIRKNEKQSAMIDSAHEYAAALNNLLNAYSDLHPETDLSPFYINENEVYSKSLDFLDSLAFLRGITLPNE